MCNQLELPLPYAHECTTYRVLEVMWIVEIAYRLKKKANNIIITKEARHCFLGVKHPI